MENKLEYITDLEETREICIQKLDNMQDNQGRVETKYQEDAFFFALLYIGDSLAAIAKALVK